MSYQLTENRLRHHREQGHTDNAPSALFKKILSIPRSVDSWAEEGRVIDGLPFGEAKKLSMIRMQCAATDHKVLWFQGHVYSNYEAIGAAVDAASEASNQKNQCTQ